MRNARGELPSHGMDAELHGDIKLCQHPTSPPVSDGNACIGPTDP